MISIDGWQIDTDASRIARNGVCKKLEPRSMELLLYFAEHPDQVVSRQEIEDSVWKDRVVGYEALSVAIGKIRKAFEDNDKKHRVIETIPKLGYRLIAPVLSTGTEPELFRHELPGKPSIAVLPFTNISGDPQQELFADGLTYDIIMGLSVCKPLFVIARGSSFVYKGRDVDLQTIAGELGVQYLLEGSVSRSTDRCRVNVQLVDSKTGHPVWSQQYNRELADLFELQDDIKQSVVASVTVQVMLVEGHHGLAGSRTDIRLWDLLNQATSLNFELTKESLEKSLKVSERTLSLYPDNAQATMSVANALFHMVVMGYEERRGELLQRARDLAERALQTEEENEWFHVLYAWILLEFGEEDQAIEEIERGIEINSNFAILYGGMADVLSYKGQPEKAVENAMLAIRLNPMDPSNFLRFIAIARAYFSLREYQKAIEWAKKALQRRRDFHEGHVVLIASLSAQGEMEQASGALNKYLELYPDTTAKSLVKLGTTAVQFKPPDRKKVIELLVKAGMPKSED